MVSFFSNLCFQQAVVGGQYSEWSPAISGVLQGSVLVALFILYVDNLCNIINQSCLLMMLGD